MKRKSLHNHPTVRNPENGKFFYPDCPACISSATFIEAITREGCTQEEYDKAVKAYHKKD